MLGQDTGAVLSRVSIALLPVMVPVIVLIMLEEALVDTDIHWLAGYPANTDLLVLLARPEKES